ncbi:MAG: phospholipase D family protein [Betaproteobacteria bacterium]
MRRRSNPTHLALLGIGVMALLAGCASLPPGSDFAKTSSSALARPEQTRMGRQLAAGKAEHPGNSGFKLLPVGTDSFLLRMEMAQAAERTLDVQYFLIQSDDTGQLLIEALLKAADRGVRVRVLLDDAGSFGRDAQIRTLAGYPNVQLRLFNPFAYRGNVGFVHGAEFFADATRLNYRMHNKLFVVDNEISIVGGRNIGDEYFQGGRDYEFGDYDIIAAGPIVNEVSKSFDAFWNNPMAIPIEALAEGKPSAQDLEDYRGVLAAHHAKMIEADAPYMRVLAANQPLTAMLDGKSSLAWAKGEVVYDSPEKAKVQDGEQGGRLLRHRLGEVAKQVQTELIVVSPYLVPGAAGMKFLTGLRERNVNVRILTNSLASTDMPVVHSGYQAFRAPLLGTGVDLYEVRPVLGAPVVRGTRLRSLSSGGQYALHAKVFVFDRERVFVGSMNLDQRSLHLNTEIGLIIESPELARQIALRFADITQPANSYVLMLGEADRFGQRHLVWRTLENGTRVDFDQDPDVTFWQRLQIDMLSMLPLDDLL